MEEAYRTSIEDFRIALMSCGPFDWESRTFYEEQIEHYERKLEKLGKIEEIDR